MKRIPYGMKVRTELPVADAEALVRDRLADQGFGVLTEIDVADTLQARLGIDRSPYRILGACNPELAAQALDSEPDVGLLLPCNIAVYEDGDESVVAVLDPEMMVNLAANPLLGPVAADARARLDRVLEAVARGR